MATKSVSPVLNYSVPKFEIVDYFDAVTNQIDIEAETKITLNEKSQESSSLLCIKRINYIRNHFLDTITQLKFENLNHYSQNKENYDLVLANMKNNEKDRRNKVLFKKFAFYLNSQCLENSFSSSILGLIMILDFYIVEKDLNLLK